MQTRSWHSPYSHPRQHHMLRVTTGTQAIWEIIIGQTYAHIATSRYAQKHSVELARTTMCSAPGHMLH